MFQKEFLQILACPSCKTSLFYDEVSEILKCHICHRMYPIRDGIPILLIDQAIIEA